MSPPLIVTQQALKYAPWSFSKIETADSCPAQFEHRHLLKSAKAVSTSDTKVGTAAHAVLELMVQGASQKVAKEHALATTPLTSDELETLRSLEDRIETFLRKFDTFCKAQGVTKPLVEIDWAFTKDFAPTSFFAPDAFFRGKLDLCAVTRDNDLIVVDHKSGVAKDLKWDTKKRQQLNAYAVLALPNLPNINGVRGGIHFMQGAPEKAIQWADYVDTARVRNVLAPWLFSRINETAETLVAPFQAKPNLRWPCEWCNFQSLCPAFQEKYGIPQEAMPVEETY